MTVIVTVPVLESAVPSVARYVKLTMPLKLATGVKVNDPSALSATLPSSGCTGLTSVAVSTWPSASVSLASTPGAGTVRTVSSVVL